MNFTHALLLFLFASRTFTGIPVSIYYQIEVAVLVVYLFLALVSKAKAIQHIRFFGIATLLLLISVISAFQANANFGQPLDFGMLANRGFLVIVMPLYFIIYRANNQNTKSVIDWLVKILKVYIALVFIFSIILDPKFVAQTLNWGEPMYQYFVDYSTSLGGNRFKFSPLPGFLFMVYFFSSSTKKKFDLVTLILFLSWLAFLYGGRIAIVSTLLFFIALSVRFLRTQRGVFLIGPVAFALTLLSASVLWLTPQGTLEDRISGFSQAVGVFTGTDSSLLSDVSSASRVLQLYSLNSYVRWEDYTLGIGQLSAQWQGGFERIFGRFHPSDLGILGFLSIYGVVGIFVFILVLQLNISREIYRSKNFYAIMILLISFSIPTGLIFFHIPFATLCILLIKVLHEHDRHHAASRTSEDLRMLKKRISER